MRTRLGERQTSIYAHALLTYFQPQALIPTSTDGVPFLMKRYLPFGIILTVAVVALGGGAKLYHAKRETVLPPVQGEAAAANPGANPPHFRGAVKAPVVLEEFGDLQCPPCAAFSALLKKIEHEYTGRVRVVFRQFPMVMHPHAVEAARATEAAAVQGRFWEMADSLYETQVEWSKAADVQPLFEQYAQKIGLDLARYKTDRESNPLLGRIGMDSERGRALGVTATPTVFLNSQRVPIDSMTEPGLRAAIDALLKGDAPFPSPAK